MSKREKSFVGADLHAIMDDHGMLNPLVSRQLSVMSHYSVRVKGVSGAAPMPSDWPCTVGVAAS